MKPVLLNWFTETHYTEVTEKAKHNYQKQSFLMSYDNKHTIELK